MHAADIEKTRQSLEQQKIEDLQKHLDEKLRNASTLRDDNIKKILGRLKEHVRIARANQQPISYIDVNQASVSISIFLC